MAKKESKTSNEIFNELEELCSSPGFIHIICSLDLFSNSIFSEEGKGLSGEQINEFINKDLPIRSEICILIGLLCKQGSFDTTALTIEEFNQLESKTLTLLQKLQHSQIFFDTEEIEEDFSSNEIANVVLKENILYGGESFYDFQYVDLAPKKYINDSDWFIKNKGYSLDELVAVMRGIDKNYHENIHNTFEKIYKFVGKEDRIHTIFNDLSSHTLNIEYISAISNVNRDKVLKVLDSFMYDFSSMNSTFLSDSDFNLTNAYPIFKVDEKYILLSRVNLYEALYETPFFWFISDKSYRPTASKNRGDFTEEFSEECLIKVFGAENVFTNINIEDHSKEVGRKKGDNVVGEIDVLVIYANKAIILQAKSKKLTIEARKGNFRAINNDFKSAIQDSYDQGHSCSELIQNKKLKLIKEDGSELKIKRDFDDIFIVCVVSDHYPSLSTQVREMLSYKTTDIIREPFIMDIFLLDVLSEIIPYPLYFIDYIKKRASTFKVMYAQNELVVFGYYLKMNISPQSDFTMMTLLDDIASDLDAAMVVRRKGYKGEDTPKGMLTDYQGTFYSDLINQFIYETNPLLFNLGLFFLSIDSQTIEDINNNTEYLVLQNSLDEKGHSITLGFTNNASVGIIFHTNHVDFIYAKRYFRRSFEYMINNRGFKDNYAIYFDAKSKEILDIRVKIKNKD